MIQNFNKNYLSHDYPTDVIAFPYHNEAFKPQGYLGDCLVSIEMACEKASEFGNNPDEELALYIIHGILHLLGYRDKTKKDFEMMNTKQNNHLLYFRKRLLKEKLIDHA